MDDYPAEWAAPPDGLDEASWWAWNPAGCSDMAALSRESGLEEMAEKWEREARMLMAVALAYGRPGLELVRKLSYQSTVPAWAPTAELVTAALAILEPPKCR